MKQHPYRILIFTISFIVATFSAKAQNETTQLLEWSVLHGLEYEIYAGVNIGGTAPMPMPAEIRKIDGYNPMLNLALGGNVTKWIDTAPQWGFSVGICFENKGMDTKATVKNYGMEIIQDGSRIAGNWTGRVDTKYHTSLITFPVLARWRPTARWNFHLGPYIGLSLNHEFSGTVHDGYLREGDPTGTKVVFEGEAEAPYNFDSDLRTFQYGLQGGASWRAFKHLALRANLSWGLNDIFKKSFKTVEFPLYPIYANLGFNYIF
ncbi:porin family protein [uncultured Muribaculum sp.]|uniref:porin family protein n=1 Tax=uncultured Muribaculum sp. TaxID=1918613 RepID=UPI0025CD15DD|nr:porin family protein [uncultured Muribaculum sp.]